MNFINKQELKYLFYTLMFSLIWFMFLLPKLLPITKTQSPFIQFMFFNLGIFIFIQIFLKAKSSNSKMDIMGSIGVIALFICLDILMPPLAVDFNGNLLTGLTLSESASDYVVGYFATNILNLNGILVFLFTYILTPMILLIISSKLLPNFVRHL